MKLIQRNLLDDERLARRAALLKGNVIDHFFISGKCNDAIQLYTEALSYDPQNFVYNATVYCNRSQSCMVGVLAPVSNGN